MIAIKGAPQTQNEKPNKFFVNGSKYETLKSTITGLELKQMAGLSPNEMIYLINQGSIDILIDNDDLMDLSRPGVEHFSSQIKEKEFKLIVNAREKKWEKNIISFEQLIELAFGSFDNSDHIVYTAAYDKGPKENRSGVFVKSQSVYLTNNMIFNATRTDKS